MTPAITNELFSSFTPGLLVAALKGGLSPSTPFEPLRPKSLPEPLNSLASGLPLPSVSLDRLRHFLPSPQK
jgi:hypothetical protein